MTARAPDHPASERKGGKTKVLFPKVPSRFCAKKKCRTASGPKTAAPRHFPGGMRASQTISTPAFALISTRTCAAETVQTAVKNGSDREEVMDEFFFALMARSKKLSHQTVWVETSALQQKEGWGDLIQTLSPSPPLSGQPG